MKNSIVIFLFLLTHYSFAQKEMKTTVGTIRFEASVPFCEEVAATNKSVSCILNTKTGALTIEAPMEEFRFKLSLMEDHFNQKYLETDQYPNAYFKGVIVGFNLNIIDSTSKTCKLKGELKIHGITKKIDTIVLLKKINNKLEIHADFNVNVKDFNIEIPEILSMKVAEKVQIVSHFVLQ
jgi:polyisoprenoid-binding protein YceI